MSSKSGAPLDDYWTDREMRDHSWPHNLFAEIYRSDPTSRPYGTKRRHIPQRTCFTSDLTARLYLMHQRGPINRPSKSSSACFKITHKLERPHKLGIPDGCYLHQAEIRTPPTSGAVVAKRILVGWYGSFCRARNNRRPGCLESVVAPFGRSRP